MSLVTFINPKPSSTANKSTPMPGIKDISGIFSIERNTEGQIYLQQNLHNSGHCTMITSSVQDKLFDKTLLSSTSSGTSNSNTVQVPYCHVPKTANYISHDRSFVVINNDKLSPDLHGIDQTVREPIHTATRLVQSMFKNGIEHYFKFDSQKRNSKYKEKKHSTYFRHKASKSNNSLVVEGTDGFGFAKEDIISKSSLPIITLGYTNSDCNKYADNLSTVAGTIAPSIMDGDLSDQILKDIISLVEMVLKFLPSDHCFNIDKVRNKDEIRAEIRRQLWSQLKSSLGGDTDTLFFRIEGITIVIPVSVGWHYDVLNCKSDGFRSVISINVRIPINVSTFSSGPDSVLANWLECHGFTKYFPVSILIYSRAVVGSYAAKLSKSVILSGKSPLHDLIHWGLHTRVGKDEDYRSKVWNNNNFGHFFNSTAKKGKPTSTFKGRMIAATAAYEKMVS